MKQFVFICISLMLLTSVNILSQQFGFREDKGIIESNEINEASGIAASKKNPGVLWTHNDSGDKSRIFAIDSSGNTLATFYLAGVQNRDWEDICIGPGDTTDEQYIYIGNIGDNSKRYFPKYIYKIVEPKLTSGVAPTDTIISNVDRLAFGYENGKRNAETLMIDPKTLDLYVVSKEQNTKVYQIAYPYTFTSSPSLDIDTAKVVATLPFSTAVGGDISPDGNEILIKTKSIIYYWQKEESETVIELLQKTPTTVPYFKEPQGEAVCWAPDSSGYYTISEGSHPHLYFYPRLVTDVELNNNIPTEFKLEQNYPNPFNPTTTIEYTIPTVVSKHALTLRIKVYDVLGKEVATLVNTNQKPGSYKVTFDAKDMPSGIYLYQLSVGSFVKSKKMILLK